jgi:hypothetical protein
MLHVWQRIVRNSHTPQFMWHILYCRLQTMLKHVEGDRNMM